MIDEDFEKRWKILMDHREKIFNINSYIADGFEKICDVYNVGPEWRYKNINKSLMFSVHNSWVYFIVQGDSIVKCGETGNPLGIPEVYSYRGETQPIGSSKCRFGRLRRGDGTDSYIRQQLNENIRAGLSVSLWAKKCKLHVVNERIGGVKHEVDTSIHKHLEQMYLEYFKQEAGCLPLLNKASK